MGNDDESPFLSMNEQEQPMLSSHDYHEGGAAPSQQDHFDRHEIRGDVDMIEQLSGGLFPYPDSTFPEQFANRRFVQNVCLSMCCGPCWLSYNVRKAGATSKEAALVLLCALLLHGGGMGGVSCLLDNVKSATCCQACLAILIDAIPGYLIAGVINDRNIAWGGTPHRYKYTLCSWCCSCPFAFQFANAVDSQQAGFNV